MFGHLTKFIGYKRLSYATLIANRDNDYDQNDLPTNDSVMEPLTSVTNGSSITTNDPSNTINRDVGIIKQKLNSFVNEHYIQQEWILLAHILNRLCFLIYLFFFSFSIGHHLFL